MSMHDELHIAIAHSAIDPVAFSVSLAIFGTVTYAICIGLALVLPAMADSMKVLYPAIFPGFVWLTTESIITGLALILLYSAYVGCGFAFLYNAICRQLHQP